MREGGRRVESDHKVRGGEWSRIMREKGVTSTLGCDISHAHFVVTKSTQELFWVLPI